MDPLSLTASAIAVATAALQSAKAVHGLIDGLANAPQTVIQTKSLLSRTETTLDTLKRTLIATPKSLSVIDAVLQEIEIGKVLESTDSLCQEFKTAMTGFTSHSTNSQFSKRDRVTVYLNESKINRFNKNLTNCQRTITMVVSSITLIISSHTSGDIEQLRGQFEAQEQALIELGAQLSTRETGSEPEDHNNADDRQPNAQLTAILKDTCRKTLMATREQRTMQRFGNMQMDKHSTAMQGIVGVAQPGVDQSFGNLTATTNSRGFQGQMDAESFAKFLGK